MFQVGQKALASIVFAVIVFASAAYGRDRSLELIFSAEHDADVRCRGGLGDDPATQDTCKIRDKLVKVLYAKGYCWGKIGQIGADMRWHKCGPNSQRLQ